MILPPYSRVSLLAQIELLHFDMHVYPQNRPLLLIALFAIGIIFFSGLSALELARQSPQPQVEKSAFDAVVQYVGGQSSTVVDTQKKQIPPPEVTVLNAAKRAMYRAEGTWARYDKDLIEGCPNAPYSIGFAHECLSDFSRHPDKPVQFAPGLYTTVAFAGQWMQSTYEELWDKANTCGFNLDQEMYSPENQEIALTCKWWKLGALDTLWSSYVVDDQGVVRFMREHLPKFADKLCTVWAGVPCSDGDGGFNTPEYGSQKARPLSLFIDWMVEELAYEQGLEGQLKKISQIKFPIEGYDWASAQAVFTSGYKWRWGRWHRGLDFGVPVGTPLIAPEDGWVEAAGGPETCGTGYGNCVVFRPHRDPSLYILMAHMDTIAPGIRSCPSDRDCVLVSQGDKLGTVGNTGYSTGPHLHISLGLNQWVSYAEMKDPTWYLRQSLAELRF